MEDFPFSMSLDENISALQKTFERDDTLVLRRLQSANGRRFCVVFLEGMVDSHRINQSVVRPLSIGNIPDAWTECGQLDGLIECDETHVFSHGREALKVLMRGVPWC